MKSDKKKCKISHGKKVVAAVFTLIAVAAIVNAIVFAKYYAQESRKSVITASGLYFSSNCLSKVDSVDDRENFPSYVTSNAWTGAGAAVLPIYIYNYDNILLYNDANLNITYNLYICLMDDDDTAEYAIEYSRDGESIVNKQILEYDTVYIIDNLRFEGGSAKSKMITLTVSPKGAIDTENYISGRVAVWAVPTYPDYVANAIKLAANIQMRPSKGEFTCHGGLTVATDLEGLNWATDGIEKINSMVGYIYNIKSTGDTKGVNYYYRISWDNTLFQIDLYNSYYIKAAEDGKVDVNGSTTSMDIEAIPYSSVNISFYKAEGFDPTVFDDTDDFLDTVTMELISE